MHEIEVRFDGNPVRLDTDILGAKIQCTLEEAFESDYQRIHVDIDSFATASPYSEWRINLPPNHMALYVAMGKLIAETNAFAREFIKQGRMIPRTYVVTVWLLTNKQPAIIGSCD